MQEKKIQFESESGGTKPGQAVFALINVELNLKNK